MKAIKLYIILFLVSLSCFSQTGKVVGVKDGDTVVILDEKNVQHTVRVADIDCPEKNQPFGKKAKWFTSDEIFAKEVTIQVKDPNNPRDKYGRIIGYVLYDCKNLSHELLNEGLAWHYKYYSDDAYMASLEKKAIKNKRGLWVEPNPINPYQWRKGQRN